MNQFSIDPAYTIDLLQKLVRINSINPELDPQAPGEEEIAAFIAKELDGIGLQVEVLPIAPGRSSVVGVLKGSDGGRSLMLNGHIDTVGVQGMQAPFEASVQDGRLYGRGAQDMKGSLAAMICAVKTLVEEGFQPDGDLILAAVADEETMSKGTTQVLERYRTQAAIVTEPTELAVCLGHRGFTWFDVETFGRAAHGSRYTEGIDANIRMGRFLARLDRLEQELRQRPEHPLLGTPSLHVALLKGGSEISTYAAHCLAQLERRTLPGETLEQIEAEMQVLLDRLAAEDSTFRARLTRTFSRHPFEIDPQAAIVQAVAEATGRITHQPVRYIGQTFWTDAALLAKAGIETVLIGPTGSGLHGVEEWVEIRSVIDLSAILAESVRGYYRLTMR